MRRNRSGVVGDPPKTDAIEIQPVRTAAHLANGAVQLIPLRLNCNKHILFRNAQKQANVFFRFLEIKCLLSSEMS